MHEMRKARNEGLTGDLCKGKCRQCGATQPCNTIGTAANADDAGNRDEQHDWDGSICKRCGKTRKMPPAIKENIGDCLTGDHIAFGKWNGAPLYWIVLSVQDDKLLLITKECLGAKPFDLSQEATWDTCSLRGELNGEYFYANQDVFSKKERQAILITANDSPEYIIRTYAIGKRSTVSREVIRRIMFSCSMLWKHANISTSPEKARCATVWDIKHLNFRRTKAFRRDFPWWLRNSTRRGAAAVVVTTEGMINYNGFTISERYTPQVRPAMWIKK